MEEENKKRVLITGGAGYVGQVLLEEIPKNWKTTIIDNVYVNMGTPKLLKEFNFWENYFNAK